MADFDAQLPVRALAINFTTEVADANGITINPAADYAQASTTLGQDGVLDQGATTTAAPVYVNGTTNPLSLDTAGNLRVSSTVTNFPALQNVNIADVGGNPVTTTLPVSGTVAVTQSTTPWVVSGTVTANLGTVDGLALDATLTNGTQVTSVSNFPAIQPVSGTVAVSNFPADADALAQGSTTAGQLGALEMGAVTTAAPTYVTGQTDPLSLTTTGALRVTNINGGTGLPTVELINYNTAAAVAPLATSTHTFTPGTNVYLDAFNFAASGQMKAEMQIGGVTQFVYFTSKSTLSYEVEITNPIFVASGTAITIIRTNMDLLAMDVYSTIQYHL
jgi:hypothetical protein